MFNLILKDMMLLKKSLWFQVGLWVFFMVESPFFGIPFLIISLAMANIPLSIDEKNKTENLFVSLPVKRSTIVIARYLYTIFVIAVVIAVTYFFSRVLNILFPPYFEKKIVSFHSLLAAQLPVMFLMSLACPMFFCYGSHLEKGIRVVVIAISVVFGFIILFIVAWDMGFDVTAFKLVYTFLGMCVLMLISFGISLLVYNRREF